jgi:hypothetical protein
MKAELEAKREAEARQPRRKRLFGLL